MQNLPILTLQRHLFLFLHYKYFIISSSVDCCEDKRNVIMIMGLSSCNSLGSTNFFLGTRFFGRVILLTCPIEHAKKLAHKTKVYSRSRSNKKYCFLFFITYIGLTAFILNMFTLKIFATRFLDSEFCFNV